MNDRVGRLPLWVVLLSAALLAGCSGDNPTKPKPPSGPALSVRSTPQDVLKYLEYVYSNRDSVAIKSIYDSTYVGISTDMTNQTLQVLEFGYSDEVAHVAALARAHSISSVTLKFRNLIRLGSGDVSHPEWATIQVPGSNMLLEIEDGPEGFNLASAGITEAFSFKPTAPDSTSPTDTTWKIVRWSEVSVYP